MGDAAVQDVGPPDPVLHRVYAALDLGDHSPADDPGGHEAGDLVETDLGDKGV